ncbi:MAG: hypothetical protein DSY47_01710 [Hydrogenothermus sp.]|nr:MAG: hypothetical protein DSY47_01710 [Hydrogenothermus sp.]
MFRFIFVFFLIIHFSFAHSVQYKVSHKNAVVIKIFFADGTPFSYEKFEIYAPDNTKIPYQVGRTDKYGRITFIPNKVGYWTVKAFSEDGHGIIKKIYIDDLSKVSESQNQFGYLLKIFIGVLIILLIYWLLYLSARRKRVEKTE